VAERGDRRFGGDPEDHLCTWVPACRSLTAQSTFLQKLRAAAQQRPDDGWAVGQSAYARELSTAFVMSVVIIGKAPVPEQTARSSDEHNTVSGLVGRWVIVQ
jgi:hypothetical protein